MCAILVNGYFDSLIREAEKDSAFVRPSFGLLSDSPLPFMLLTSVRHTEEESLNRYVLEDTGRPIEFRSAARTSIQLSDVAAGRGWQAPSTDERNRSTGQGGSIGNRSTGDDEVDVDSLQPY